MNNLDKKSIKRVFFTLRMKKNTVNIAAYGVIYTGVAQLVEHRSPKPSAGSSSLSTRASLWSSSAIYARPLF